jgi:hypothetical protein
MAAGWRPGCGGAEGAEGTCIIHLIRNTFRLASKQHWGALKRDVKPICTTVNPFFSLICS